VGERKAAAAYNFRETPRPIEGGRQEMCGWYTLTTPVGVLAEEFGVTGPLPEVSPSYNIAPTQEVAAVLVDSGERCLEMLRWGLIPSEADDPEIARG
jgi:putative SOS response-associated peptidase YedK